MDIQNLKAFIQVSECGSFSRAAEKLFITQPAVSKRISSLEQELGEALFDRIGKSVQLTAAGEALMPSAQRILAEMEESKRLINNLNNKVCGTLSIGTSHHIGLHRLPPVLRAFTAQFPDVDLDIHFMDSEAACEAVLNGKLELAVATLPEKKIHNLHSEIIWPDPIGVVVGTQHPLAAQTIISRDELLEHSAILPSQQTFTRALMEKALKLQHSKLKVAMETNYLETIKMMVSIGLGWSVIPTSMLDKELKHIEIRNIHMQRQLGFAHHQERTLSNAGKKLCQLLQKSNNFPLYTTQI